MRLPLAVAHAVVEIWGNDRVDGLFDRASMRDSDPQNFLADPSQGGNDKPVDLTAAAVIFFLEDQR